MKPELPYSEYNLETLCPWRIVTLNRTQIAAFGGCHGITLLTTVPSVILMPWSLEFVDVASRQFSS